MKKLLLLLLLLSCAPIKMVEIPVVTIKPEPMVDLHLPRPKQVFTERDNETIAKLDRGTLVTIKLQASVEINEFLESFYYTGNLELLRKEVDLERQTLSFFFLAKRTGSAEVSYLTYQDWTKSEIKDRFKIGFQIE